MMTMLSLLIGLQSGGDIESLIRDLDSDSLEIRQSAQAALINRGHIVSSALRRALETADAEFRIRAGIILDRVERGERERLHDLDQMEALLLLHRKENARPEKGEIDTEGARFRLSALYFDGGWIIRSDVQDHLQRRLDPGPGRSQLGFDVHSVKNEAGRNLKIERCGSCSPRLVYVRAHPGALKVRICGEHAWFSPYTLEFKNPVLGQRKQVGDYTIEVTEIELKVQASGSFPFEWIRSMGSACQVEFDPALKAKRPDFIG